MRSLAAAMGDAVALATDEITVVLDLSEGVLALGRLIPPTLLGDIF